MALIETVKDQAQSNYWKNRGSPGQWFEHKADYREPQPQPRIRPEAAGCAEHNRPTVDEVFHNYQLRPESTSQPVRLRDDEARQIAEKQRHQDDKWFDFQGNQAFRPKPRPTRVYPPSNIDILHRANQSAESDWFGHVDVSAPASSLKATQLRCGTEAGRRIASAMRASHSDDWFRHDARPDSAPQNPAGRNRPEAVEFAERNRRGAGAGVVGNGGGNGEFVVVYGNRCPTASAKANCEAARGVQMRDCFDYDSRKQQEQQQQQQQQQQQRRRYHSEQQQQQQQPPPMRKVRPEAEAFAEKAKGSLGDWFDQDKNRRYNSPRPQPRTKTEVAQAAASRNRGVMDSCLGNTEYRMPPREHKTHERSLKSDVAKEVAVKSRGDAVKQLVGTSNLPPEPPRKSKASSVDVVKSTAGLVITGAAPPSARCPAHRVRPEASDTAVKHRGGDFFKTIQMRPPSAR